MLQRLSLFAAVSCMVAVTGCGILPPVTPEAPTGPVSGDVGTSYRFSAVTIDRLNLPLRYQFTWGDGQVSEWSQCVPSGVPVTLAHAWRSAGRYAVQVRAQNVAYKESDLSPRHSIIVGSQSGYPDTVIAAIYVGGDPHGVCRLAGGNRLYVGNESFNGVFVVDVDELRVIDTIPCGEHPWQLVASPDDRYVYVANLHSNSVSVIETRTNSIVSNVAVGVAPHAIACLPDGSRVYVANIDTHDVSVIRTSDNAVVATVHVGNGPRGLCILPNGEYVYTANTSSSVSVIRTADNTVVATIPVSDYPHRATASSDGRYVYVSTANAGSVTVIRTSDNTVIGTVPVDWEPHGGGALPGADYVYIASPHANSLTVVRTSDNTVAATIPVGAGCCEVAFSSAGDRAYTPDRSAKTVTVIGLR
jgi:YVTN family beta-propeller protein